MRIGCSLFGHKRSRDWITRYGEVVMSRCGRCGVRMVREGPGEWRVAEQHEVDALMPAGKQSPDSETRAA